MNSANKKKMIERVTRQIDLCTAALRGSTLDDKEFNEIALHTNRFLQEVYIRNANQTRTNKEAYNKAMAALREVRSLAKPY